MIGIHQIRKATTNNELWIGVQEMIWCITVVIVESQMNRDMLSLFGASKSIFWIIIDTVFGLWQLGKAHGLERLDAFRLQFSVWFVGKVFQGGE